MTIFDLIIVGLLLEVAYMLCGKTHQVVNIVLAVLNIIGAIALVFLHVGGSAG